MDVSSSWLRAIVGSRPVVIAIGRDDIVWFRIDNELHSPNLCQPFQPRLANPMPTIHQPTICGQDNRKCQVSIPDTPCVFRDCAAGRYVRSKPAILIEFSDLVDGDGANGRRS
jgi:hypothetical protein